MNISQETNKHNLKEIDSMQERWKQIAEVTLKSLSKPVPSATNFSSGTYKTGDGEITQPVRPGSEDHKKWSSKGLLSDVLNNVDKHE